ncbi:hypothetical protein GPA10_41030 [Streptomyces sp. p1417]|uniref:Uncharacterized protein n=1 Tax=Streptomyces typhae TaxID=2681492 RepID=A0A6L6XAF4_9ACTN|nr:hypothetical protein [Streptomyces typhae]MVO90955.1 hypothetical protein [Streptomyces typhae]
MTYRVPTAMGGAIAGTTPVDQRRPGLPPGPGAVDAADAVCLTDPGGSTLPAVGHREGGVRFRDAAECEPLGQDAEKNPQPGREEPSAETRRTLKGR